jgi:hypothetical protein
MSGLRWLFWAPTGEHKPPVQRGGALFTTTTRPYPKGRGDSLDDTTETNIFVKNESWKAHFVGQTITPLCLKILGLFFGQFFGHRFTVFFAVAMN